MACHESHRGVHAEADQVYLHIEPICRSERRVGRDQQLAHRIRRRAHRQHLAARAHGGVVACGVLGPHAARGAGVGCEELAGGARRCQSGSRGEAEEQEE